MKAAAARMSVASPARRLMRPVSASTEAKTMIEREGGQRRQMTGQQSAPESQAQSRTSRGGFGFGGGQGERVRPERIRSGSPPSWLARRLGDERERMQTIGEFRRQEIVDQAMPLDPAPPLESRRHDPDPIMRAPALARSRVSRMAVGLIDDVEGDRIERRRQTRDNSLLHDQLRTPVKPFATLHILAKAGGT